MARILLYYARLNKEMEQLPRSRPEMEAHLAALAKVRSAPEHEALFGHLYDVLSILDAKAASLLSFNSIVIAVFAIFLTGH